MKNTVKVSIVIIIIVSIVLGGAYGFQIINKPSPITYDEVILNFQNSSDNQAWWGDTSISGYLGSPPDAYFQNPLTDGNLSLISKKDDLGFMVEDVNIPFILFEFELNKTSRKINVSLSGSTYETPGPNDFDIGGGNTSYIPLSDPYAYLYNYSSNEWQEITLEENITCGHNFVNQSKVYLLVVGFASVTNSDGLTFLYCDYVEIKIYVLYD